MNFQHRPMAFASMATKNKQRVNRYNFVMKAVTTLYMVNRLQSQAESSGRGSGILPEIDTADRSMWEGNLCPAAIAIAW